MHFVQNMSNCLGLESKKPFIQESFFPVTPEKYITICTENHQSKQWDHFQEYIDLIKPILHRDNIQIIEIGSNKIQLQKIISLKNVTSANQWSFIIKNSLCHIGPENFMSSLAAFYHVPSVSLFSNTTSNYSSPNWAGTEYKTHAIEVASKNKTASFSATETPKTINQISAEEVAAQTLSCLSIKNDFSKYDVFYIGPAYHMANLEIIPDFIPEPNFFPSSLLNIRLDYHFNTEPLPHFANDRRLSLISDREMPIEKLHPIKQNINNIFLQVDESFDIKYVKDLKARGFKVELVIKENADVNNTRLNFFDWKLSETPKSHKKSIDNQDKICDTTRYKSSKMIFSKKGQFSSKFCFDKNISIHQDQMIVNEDKFWQSSHHYKLYNLI